MVNEDMRRIVQMGNVSRPESWQTWGESIWDPKSQSFTHPYRICPECATLVLNEEGLLAGHLRSLHERDTDGC